MGKDLEEGMEGRVGETMRRGEEEGARDKEK